jgi:general secretion pathway protein I
MRARGFSLLEVMVAVSILGLALTVILSAQGGLAASNKAAANMGVATTLARCKMTELEEKLLKLGWPLNDEDNDQVACCNDITGGAFLCDTKVDKILLPNPPQNTVGDGGSMFDLLGAAASPSASSGALTGAIGALGGAGGLGSSFGGPLSGNAAGGAGLDFDAGLQGIGQGLMSGLGGGPGGAAGGVSGLLQMVMGMVYPFIKPMFEASIRRLTVIVRWKEGPNPKEFTLIQYVTNPQQSGFVAGVAPSASAGGATLAPPTAPGAGNAFPGGSLPPTSGAPF